VSAIPQPLSYLKSNPKPFQTTTREIVTGLLLRAKRKNNKKQTNKQTKTKKKESKF